MLIGSPGLSASRVCTVAVLAATMLSIADTDIRSGTVIIHRQPGEGRQLPPADLRHDASSGV